MREFQKKRRFKKIIYSKTSLVILAVILFLMVRAVWNAYGKERQSRSLELQSALRLADLQSQETQLYEQNTQLSTPDGVENQIRQDYHMVKPGEQLAVIIDAPTTTSSADQAEVESSGFWSSIWHLLKGFF